MVSDEIAVRVSRLGKKYLVPQKHVDNYSREPTLGERMKEFFPSILGAEERDYFWALRDVSFEVRRGEALGIVGENGSGKSTLLKILSGVTTPSEGTAEMRGRIGSLLEVGTGFHPDLSGRENIFFNGALLGLSAKEVRSKLEEIIDFSGIGDFIDVPVKRYSSGMYVRLAYSVAALLKSDILILDEVLAVGDHSFRERTQDHVRKMTKQGRTILFVSHSAQSINQVCDRAIILYKGRIAYTGPTKEVLAEYQSRDYVTDPVQVIEQPPEPKVPPAAPNAQYAQSTKAAAIATAAEKAHETAVQESQPATLPRRRHYQPCAFMDISKVGRLKSAGRVVDPTHVLKWVSIHDIAGEPCAEFATFDGLKVRIGFEGVKNPSVTYFSVLIHNSRSERMITAHSTHIGRHLGINSSGVIECVIPSLLIGDGIYAVMVDTGVYDFDTNHLISQDCVSQATYIQIRTSGQVKGVGLSEFQGSLHPSNWSIVNEQ